MWLSYTTEAISNKTKREKKKRKNIYMLSNLDVLNRGPMRMKEDTIEVL